MYEHQEYEYEYAIQFYLTGCKFGASATTRQSPRMQDKLGEKLLSLIIMSMFFLKSELLFVWLVVS